MSPVMDLLVTPNEKIQFQGPFTEVVSTEVILTNQCESVLAYKVKTTAPRRYAVRPNSGSLQPAETVVVSVMRQPFEADSNERLRHKFMIQSVKVNPGQNLATIWSDADPSTFMETKLRVHFEESSKNSVADEEYQRVLQENQRLSKQLDALQVEKTELVRAQAMRSSLENVQEPQKALVNKIITGLSVMVLLIACFIGGLIVKEALSSSPSDL